MRMRGRRRILVVWSHSVGPADRYGAQGLTRLARTGRVRRCIRIGALLTVMGLMRLVRGERARWRPLLAAVALIVAGVMFRSGSWGVLLLAGLWFLLYALLIPGRQEADRKLQRELAGYSARAQRRDLAATFDRYPDGITHELRDIIAS